MTRIYAAYNTRGESVTMSYRARDKKYVVTCEGQATSEWKQNDHACQRLQHWMSY